MAKRKMRIFLNGGNIKEKAKKMALVLPASSDVFVDLPAKSAFIKGLHGCRDWPVSSNVILNVLVFFKVDTG